MFSEPQMRMRALRVVVTRWTRGMRSVLVVARINSWTGSGSNEK